MNLKPRNCPVCGSSDESTLFAKAAFDLDSLGSFAFASRKTPEYMHYRIVKCPTCDVAYSSPIPSIADLAAAYKEADFDSSEEARCAAETYGSYLSRFTKKLPALSDAMDIGTGDGVFLEELLKMGFTNVSGVEPSTAPIQCAKPEIKPLIRQALFGADAFVNERFNLITCFQTIEHVFEPLELCKDAHSLLNPGGVLMLIGHNREAVSAKILGEKSPIFDIEHLQLFTVTSMTNLLSRAGFRDVQTFTVINRYPFHYLLKLAPLPPKLKQSLLNSPFANMMVSLPLGNIGVIGFKGE